MMNAKPTITTTDWTRNDGAQSTLKQPTLNELLAITFEERQYSRPPQLIWLCMGVRGTSLAICCTAGVRP